MKAEPFIVMEPGIVSYGPMMDLPMDFVGPKVAYCFGRLAPGTVITAFGWRSDTGEYSVYWYNTILPGGGTMTVSAGWEQ